jgi:hypothetical protein
VEEEDRQVAVQVEDLQEGQGEGLRVAVQVVAPLEVLEEVVVVVRLEEELVEALLAVREVDPRAVVRMEVQLAVQEEGLPVVAREVDLLEVREVVLLVVVLGEGQSEGLERTLTEAPTLLLDKTQEVEVQLGEARVEVVAVALLVEALAEVLQEAQAEVMVAVLLVEALEEVPLVALGEETAVVLLEEVQEEVLLVALGEVTVEDLLVAALEVVPPVEMLGMEDPVEEALGVLFPSTSISTSTLTSL